MNLEYFRIFHLVNQDRFDTKSGFEIYRITGPAVQMKKPIVTIFEEILKVRDTDMSIHFRLNLEFFKEACLVITMLYFGQ